MLIKYIILFSSTFALAYIAYFIRTYIKYERYDQVKQVIATINIHIASHSENRPLQQINTLLIKNDYDYCVESDVYKYYHPDSILIDMHSIREERDMTANWMIKNTYDSLPQLKNHYKISDYTPLYKLPKQLYLYFLTKNMINSHFSEGVSALCLFQRNNYFPAKQNIETNLYQNILKYHRKMNSKKLSHDCLINATIVPKTYLLHDETSCQEFFKFIQSDKFRVQVKQLGRQTTLFINKQQNTRLIMENVEGISQYFGNGTQCGKLNNTVILQQYLSNGLIINNQKIRILIYFLIASTHPVQVYLYDQEVFLDSQSNSHHPITSFIELQNQLNEYRNLSKNWNFDSLKLAIAQKIIHLIISVENQLLASSKFSQLYSAEFLMTQDLQIFITKIDSNPKIQMEMDQHFELVSNMVQIQTILLRQKYRKFRNIIQYVSENNGIWNSKIEKVIMKLDKDTETIHLPKSNRFIGIMNKNGRGRDKYLNLIYEKCII